MTPEEARKWMRAPGGVVVLRRESPRKEALTVSQKIHALHTAARLTTNQALKDHLLEISRFFEES